MTWYQHAVMVVMVVVGRGRGGVGGWRMKAETIKAALSISTFPVTAVKHCDKLID